MLSIALLCLFSIQLLHFIQDIFSGYEWSALFVSFFFYSFVCKEIQVNMIIISLKSVFYEIIEYRSSIELRRFITLKKVDI